MRRQDREITDFDEIIRVMKKCDVCRLALHHGEYPYIIPLNFGVDVRGKSITLYFHGAAEGQKYELIRQDNRVGFAMDCAHRLVTDRQACSCTMEYESVIGHGLISIVQGEDEKIRALDRIMQQYLGDESFQYNRAVLPKTTVLKLSVLGYKGKRRKKSEGKMAVRGELI